MEKQGSSNLIDVKITCGCKIVIELLAVPGIAVEPRGAAGRDL